MEGTQPQAPRTHLQPSPPTAPSLPQAPSVPPALPAKAAPRGGGAATHGPYAQVRREAAPAAATEPKYQQLVRFHTYAEPREARGGRELEEPIPFYAVGWGSGPGPQQNIYSEVTPARQDLPAPPPGGARGAFSTLPPKPRGHWQLFRSVSNQASTRRQLSAAPDGAGRERRGTGEAVEVGSLGEVPRGGSCCRATGCSGAQSRAVGRGLLRIQVKGRRSWFPAPSRTLRAGRMKDRPPPLPSTLEGPTRQPFPSSPPCDPPGQSEPCAGPRRSRLQPEDGSCRRGQPGGS